MGGSCLSDCTSTLGRLHGAERRRVKVFPCGSMAPHCQAIQYHSNRLGLPSQVVNSGGSREGMNPSSVLVLMPLASTDGGAVIEGRSNRTYLRGLC